MNRLRAWLHRLIHRAEVEAGLQEELRSYVDELTDQKISQGLPIEQARRAARLEMGSGIEQLKEACRDAWTLAWLDSLAADVRYGWRSLLRAPAFILMVVATLGPGLGLNTALFSVFNAYFLRPLPVQDPHSLYEVAWMNHGGGQPRVFNAAELEAIREQKQVFTEVLAIQYFPTKIDGNPLFGQLVSGNYFATLGIGAARGRPLLPRDSTSSIVLSYDAWKSRFGGDPEILGRKIYLRGHPAEVVGIATPGFVGLGNLTADFWAPLELGPVVFGSDPKEATPLLVTGKLRSGVSYEQASAALDVWAAQQYTAGQRLMLVSQATQLSLAMEFKKPLPFFIVFGLIVLMACANVSNMMLARSLGRQREIAIRTSLGAPRFRLVRQLLTESLLLALPSAVAGLAISAIALSLFRRAILATVPADFAFFFTIPEWSLDFRVAAYVMLAAVSCAMMFGLMPALQVTRASGGHPRRPRNVLVVGQVTVCVLFLICTAVILRSRQTMAGQSLGLRTSGVFDIRVPDRLRAGVAGQLSRNLPGVQLAAAWRAPLYGRLRTIPVTLAEETFPAGYNFVSPEYFSIFDIPIVAGRNFTSNEARAEAPAVIVSEATARLFWPGMSPLGKLLKIGNTEEERNVKQPAYSTVTVVGIARDAVSGLVGDGVDHTCLYFPVGLNANHISVILRTVAAKAAVERTVPEVGEYIVPMDDVVATQLYPFRLLFWICACLAGLALLLSATGIYGVLAYLVNQRAREFGIRMALGATAGDLIRSVLMQSLRLAGWGTAFGILLAAVIAPVFAHRMEALRPYEALPYAAGGLLAFFASLAASFFPSRRAARVDPGVSLRCE